MARVGLLQFDILWEDTSGNIARVRELVTGADAGRLDLLVLPELWPCGFTMNHDAHKSFDAAFAFTREFSRELGCPILGGLPHATATGQENRCYLVDGENVRHYTKIKVFKYAGEHHKYEPGLERHRWPVAGFQLSPFVCYDLRFPELPRATVPETDLIAYVANWPDTRVYHWRQLLVARAIENQAYVIGVNRIGSDGAGKNYNGQSLVVAPNGSIVLDAGDAEGLFVAEIDPAEVAAVREAFPFLEDI
jgi:predicted amidohydrolase